jgi:hypothetical protein
MLLETLLVWCSNRAGAWHDSGSHHSMCAFLACVVQQLQERGDCVGDPTKWYIIR